MRPFRTVRVIIVVAALAFPALGAESTPTAVELFSIISAVRVTAKSDQIADPSAFARENLEDAIRRVDESAGDPKDDGLDWQRDALLSSLTSFQYIEVVYHYELSSTKLDPVALLMRVTSCGEPSTLTVGFRLEEGHWRIHSTHSDSTKKGTSWFRSDLKPIKVWGHVPERDRSRYLNDSPLGKALHLELKPPEDCH